MTRASILGVAALAVLIGLPRPARATDVLAIVDTRIDRPTLHALGVQVLISDDDDRDASIDVRVREVGATAWRAAAPLWRVRPEEVTGRVVPEQLAGSVFDLRPGAAYELELHARDPDGPVDLTWIVGASTRAVPRAEPLTPRVRPVADAAQLRGALSSAAPGDVILLADGVHVGQFFGLSASGTPDNPIVIRGESTAGTVLDGGNCAGCNVLEVYGSWVHVERLTIRNAVRAIRFQGAGAIGNVVRRVRITDVVHGIGSQPGQLDFTISDNVIEGRLAWPLVYTDDGALHADDQGVRVDGSGHVVQHNRISGFGDPLINFADGGRSYDFHGNEILDIYGDGTELDRAEGNVRCFRNRWTNSYTAISLQPIHGGPAYVLRNVVVNVGDEQVKLKSVGGVIEPVGALVQHNTFVSPDLALNLQTPITQHDFRIENNLFIGPDVTTNGYAVDWTAAIERGTFEGNGYWPDGQYWFGTVAGNRRLHATLADAQAAGIERFGLVAAPPVFESGLVAPASFRVTMAPDDGVLAASSNAVDAARALPGVSSGFVGAAPDLGAVERGCGVPAYGPRPLGLEDWTFPVDCVPAASGVDLLRNDEIRSLRPAPDMAAVRARLAAGPPYLTSPSPGVTDPDPTVAADPTRPLVLYALTDDALTLRVSKVAGPLLELSW